MRAIIGWCAILLIAIGSALTVIAAEDGPADRARRTPGTTGGIMVGVGSAIFGGWRILAITAVAR